jgi:hypothetical protein
MSKNFLTLIPLTLLVLTLLINPQNLLADDIHKNKDEYFKFPFEMTLPKKKVYEVVSQPPEKLISYVNAQGVEILLSRPLDEKSHHFWRTYGQKLTVASDELLQAAAFDGYQGKALSPYYPHFGVTKKTVIVDPESDALNLIHEYLHTEFNIPENIDPEIELWFAVRYRSFSFKVTMLFKEPIYILNPQWRVDIHSAFETVFGMTYPRFQMGQVQEVIIHRVIVDLVKSDSPYFDVKVLEKALKDGENSANEMISVFNFYNDVLRWNQNTLNGMVESYHNQEISLPEKSDVSQESLQLFADQTQQSLQKLEPLRVHIENLKKWFVGPRAYP